MLAVCSSVGGSRRPGRAGRRHRAAGHLLLRLRKEMGKLHGLYESLMNARREAGESVAPFHKFVNLVKGQVNPLRSSGNPEVAFRVAVKDGQVSLTARGLKGISE